MTYDPDPTPGRHEASRRRLAALAALAERTGGRCEVRSLEPRAGRCTVVLGGGGHGDAAVVLSGAHGVREARRVLEAADRLVLAEAVRTAAGLRLRLAWVGGMVDVTAEDWTLAR